MHIRKMTGTEKFLLVLIVVYCIIVAAVNPAFLSWETLFDLIRSSAGNMILAMGVLVVMISGGIDVSFPAIALFGGYTATRLMMAWDINNMVFAFAVSIGIGLVLGLINALIIYLLKIEPFIVTLGTASIFHGLMTVLVGTTNIGASKLPTSYTSFGAAKLFSITDSYGAEIGVSVFIIPVILAIAVTWFMLYKTMIGRGIFAMGCSEESAKRAGFNNFHTRLVIYCFAGVLAGIMGIIYVANCNTCNPISLIGTEMSVIAAVVIGGAKMTGGQGTILGTFLGVLIMNLLNSTLVFLGFSASWNNFFIGIILLVSIGATSYQERMKNRKNFIYTE